VCTTDKPISRFPLAGLPAGLADRALISHRGVGAFAPASLSDAVYSFNPAKLSNKIRNVFCFFYKLLKIIGINVVHRRALCAFQRVRKYNFVIHLANSRNNDSLMTSTAVPSVFESDHSWLTEWKCYIAKKGWAEKARLDSVRNGANPNWLTALPARRHCLGG
jgi:hypothetical protein